MPGYSPEQGQAQKAKRHAVLGRYCARCQRHDDEVRWSNSRDYCSSCERQRRTPLKNGAQPVMAKPDKSDRPTVEDLQERYRKSGGLKRFHQEKQTDDDLDTRAG